MLTYILIYERPTSNKVYWTLVVKIVITMVDGHYTSIYKGNASTRRFFSSCTHSLIWKKFSWWFKEEKLVYQSKKCRGRSQSDNKLWHTLVKIVIMPNYYWIFFPVPTILYYSYNYYCCTWCFICKSTCVILRDSEKLYLPSSYIKILYILLITIPIMFNELYF